MTMETQNTVKMCKVSRSTFWIPTVLPQQQQRKSENEGQVKVVKQSAKKRRGGKVDAHDGGVNCGPGAACGR